ncbi:hypothetical protein BDK51DRAFT_33799 [Blyttiomyces helicus]|uniref:Uncharacterized protein n=1 Tax=Blyttiomyces helicus TaxID=388810 RepID=A0A4P9WLZ5_9FUNG|nr:hypothetical protein BDK51DRAFT_33799 [Blyttiomyces helicus]|eukprot:RKO94081.1 hypothetical protein BDK51DRAFT_33799 [Blyttiomyces helicus]
MAYFDFRYLQPGFKIPMAYRLLQYIDELDWCRKPRFLKDSRYWIVQDDLIHVESQVTIFPTQAVVMLQDSAMAPLPSELTGYDLDEQIEIAVEDALGEDWEAPSQGSLTRSDPGQEDKHESEKQNGVYRSESVPYSSRLQLFGKQVTVTDAPAVVDNVDVFEAAAVVADGSAIAQQRVKYRAIPPGRPNYDPFVERFNVPVVHEAVKKKEMWKQEMWDAEWKWVGELGAPPVIFGQTVFDSVESKGFCLRWYNKNNIAEDFPLNTLLECLIETSCLPHYSAHFEISPHNRNVLILKNMADQILATEFPAIHSDRVIDKSVYETGPRMLWCHKGMMGSRTTKQTQAFLDDHERVFPGEKYNEAYGLVDPISFQPLVPMLEHLHWTILATDEMENVDISDLAETKISKIGKASRQKVRKNSFQDDFKDEKQKHFYGK